MGQHISLTMRLIFLLFALLSLGHYSLGVYQPGTAGAEWSIKEMLAVKHLLHKMMTDPEEELKKVQAGPVSGIGGQEYAGEEILQRYTSLGDTSLTDALMPDIAKIVRLAFHDCLPDEETGGCNG